MRFFVQRYHRGQQHPWITNQTLRDQGAAAAAADALVAAGGSARVIDDLERIVYRAGPPTSHTARRRDTVTHTKGSTRR